MGSSILDILHKLLAPNFSVLVAYTCESQIEPSVNPYKRSY